MLIISCGNRNSQQNEINSYSEYEEELADELDFENEPDYNDISNEDERKKNFFNNSKGALRTHLFRDARTGLVVSSSDYPENWKVISKPTYTIDQKLPVFLTQVSGPNNLRSFNTPMKVHISYQNPQTYQFMQNTSSANLQRQMVSNEQILMEEVAPRMKNSGFKFVKNIRLMKSENYLQKKIRTESGGHVQLELLATVWKNEKDMQALVTIGKIYMHQPLSFIDTMTLWLYSTDYTFVNTQNFNETIASFENALLKTKENPKWQQYVSQLSQQRAQIAARKAQIGRVNREAAFAAHQRKMKGIWAAQDANHASFMNRNFGSGSSTSQQSFVNMINEQETVYNPLNGTNYQVNAGSTENWMDSDGNLIQNNDLFYTPNGDINLNNREWVKVGRAY